MVVIHIKRSDTEQFLFETTCATSNDQLIRDLVSAIILPPRFRSGVRFPRRARTLQPSFRDAGQCMECSDPIESAS